MSVVILLTAVVATLAVALVYVRAVAWLREHGRTRYRFEDCDTYVLLRVEHPLGGDERGLVTMLALREAAQAQARGRRLRARVGGRLRAPPRQRAGLLVPGWRARTGAPQRGVKLAVVCGRRTRAAKQFATPESSRRSNRSARPSASCGRGEPPRRAAIDPAQLDVLLTPGGRRAA